jgi:hypothetical protein
MPRQRNPNLSFAIADGVGRLGQSFVSKATSGNADFFGQRRQVPKQGGAALGAEVTRLIVVLTGVMEGVDLGLAGEFSDGGFVEIGGDAERAAGAAFAVGAVANTVHGGQGVDSDGGLAAGAGGCHGLAFIDELSEAFAPSPLTGEGGGGGESLPVLQFVIEDFTSPQPSPSRRGAIQISSPALLHQGGGGNTKLSRRLFSNPR